MHTGQSTAASWLVQLESAVQTALTTGVDRHLDVLGYGEITIVLRADSPAGPRACKRLPVFNSRSDAIAYAALIGEYIDSLRGAGVDVIDTETHLLDAPNGGCVVYCVQPTVPAERIGPNYLRELSNDDAVTAFGQIVDRLEAAVSPTLAPDGQLSNWVFQDEGLQYLDITTPMLRGENGVSRVDWAPLLANLPAPFRPYVRVRIPHILAFYHTMRGQILDFLANLRKEGLDGFYPVLLPYVEERLNLDPPITLDDIKAYYKENARDYVIVERAKRIDQWFHRKILRRPYHNLLAPVIERNPF